jgi:hypothetical protein
MTDDKPTLFDEVNAALEEVQPGSSTPKDPPEPDPDEQQQQLDDDGNPIEPPEPDEPEFELDENGEPKLDAEGKPIPKVKEPELDAEGKPIVAAAPPAAKPVAAKKIDPINDPIPKELSNETQARIRSLIAVAKESTAKVEKAENDLNYLVDGVKVTGATPQQYGEVLSWLKLFNSGDKAQQEKCLELTESICDRLAAFIGKERTVGDPLAGFDDLKAAVQAGQITAAWAKQLAVQRRQANTRSELETSVRQQNDQQAAATRELDQARNDLNALDAQLAKDDPQFAAKKKMLVPVLQPLFKTMPPSQWLGAFKAAYKNAKVGTAGSALAATRTNGGVPPNQPLRAKSPSGGGARAASSPLDALNGALAELK